MFQGRFIFISHETAFSFIAGLNLSRKMIYCYFTILIFNTVGINNTLCYTHKHKFEIELSLIEMHISISRKMRNNGKTRCGRIL